MALNRYQSPAVEVMRMTRSLRECIRDPSRTIEIPQYIAKGREIMEMQTFDQHLLDLYQAGKVKLETAREAASNPQDFDTKLALEGDSAEIEEDQSSSGSVEFGEDGRF